MVKIKLGYEVYLFTGNEQELIDLLAGLRKMLKIASESGEKIVAGSGVTITIEDIGSDKVITDGTIDTLKSEVQKLQEYSDRLSRYWHEEKEKVRVLEAKLREQAESKCAQSA